MFPRYGGKTKDAIDNVARGMLMGVAEGVPGVSGATIALLLGIYTKFIDLLHGFSDIVKVVFSLLIGKSNLQDLKQSWIDIPWRFALLLGLGMLLALGLFSNIFDFILDVYPQYLYAVFFGLIAASVFIPWEEMQQKRWQELLMISISFLAFFLILGVNVPEAQTDPSYLFLLGGGILGISGMVLPGVSGSFILLLLGLYEYVIGTLKDLTRLQASTTQLLDLGVFILGLVIGFIIFVRVLKWAFKHYQSQILAMLVGLMLASLRVLWPFLGKENGEISTSVKVSPWAVDVQEAVLVLALATISALVVMLIRDVSAQRRHKLEEAEMY